MKEKLAKKTMLKKLKSQPLLKIFIGFLIILTIVFSLSAPNQNSLYLFLILFLIFLWQRKFLQQFLSKFSRRLPPLLVFLLIGLLWSIIFELNLGRLPFHPRFGVNFFLGLGFYLPYFALWYQFIKKFKFSFWEVFSLAGASRVIFDLLITRKLLLPFILPTSLFVNLISFTARFLSIFILFGALTVFPYLSLKTEMKQQSPFEKPLKNYLLGLTPGFLAAGVLLVWLAILRKVFGRI